MTLQNYIIKSRSGYRVYIENTGYIYHNLYIKAHEPYYYDALIMAIMILKKYQPTSLFKCVASGIYIFE
jgi:hypothetical protein